MGVLSVSGSMGADGDGGSPRESAPEEPAGGAPELEKKEPEAKGEFVPYSQVTNQRQPGSRRSRAAAETEALVKESLAASLKPLEEKWGSERQTYQQQVAQQNEALARL